MLGGQGYYRGSSILISGPAGGGKTLLGGHFVDAACGRGERALFYGFEESPDQILRNLRSAGLNLERWVRKGLLELRTARPSLYGVETHLVAIHEAVGTFKPSVIVADPLTALMQAGDPSAGRSMLSRLIDFLKGSAITAVFTSLTHGGHPEEQSEVQISSLMDTWLLLRAAETNGERNRTLHVVKSRGMAHSNQMREFRITDRGVELVDVYLGPGGVLTGASRVQQEARYRSAETVRELELAQLPRGLERRRLVMEARIAELRAEFGAAEDLVRRQLAEESARQAVAEAGRQAVAHMRQADAPSRTRRRGRTR